MVTEKMVSLSEKKQDQVWPVRHHVKAMLKHPITRAVRWRAASHPHTSSPSPEVNGEAEDHLLLVLLFFLSLSLQNCHP